MGLAIMEVATPLALPVLRWCRASDFKTAIVVNILPTLATFTMTFGPWRASAGPRPCGQGRRRQLSTCQ
jgi:hypothetical protein